MKTVQGLLCSLFLFAGISISLSAQKVEVPQEWLGYYMDQEDRLVIISEEFFFLEKILPVSGYYQQAKMEEGSFISYLIEYKDQALVPQLELSATKGGLRAKISKFGADDLSLKPFNPEEANALIPKELEGLAGRWFCGEGDLVIEIDQDKVIIDGEAYKIQEAFQAVQGAFNKKFYLLEGGKKQQLLRHPNKLNEDYLALKILGHRYQHCRTRLDLPQKKSTAMEDLPHPLAGVWTNTQDPDDQVLISEDYRIRNAVGEGKIVQIGSPNTEGFYRVEYSVDKKAYKMDLRWTSAKQLILRDPETEQQLTYELGGSVPEPAPEAPNADELIPDADPNFTFGLQIGLALGGVLILVILLMQRRRRKKDGFV